MPITSRYGNNRIEEEGTQVYREIIGLILFRRLQGSSLHTPLGLHHHRFQES